MRREISRIGGDGRKIKTSRSIDEMGLTEKEWWILPRTSSTKGLPDSERIPSKSVKETVRRERASDDE